MAELEPYRKMVDADVEPHERVETDNEGKPAPEPQPDSDPDD